MCLGARDAGTNRRTARSDGPSCQNGRRTLVRNTGSLDLKLDQRLRGKAEQPVSERKVETSGYLSGG